MPVINPLITQDTCKTKMGISSTDSLLGDGPRPTYSIDNLFQSSRGLLAGTTTLEGWNNMFGGGGFIYDPRNNKIIEFYGSDDPSFGGWTNDG
jgi:hypothetical protein